MLTHTNKYLVRELHAHTTNTMTRCYHWKHKKAFITGCGWFTCLLPISKVIFASWPLHCLGLPLYALDFGVGVLAHLLIFGSIQSLVERAHGDGLGSQCSSVVRLW